MAVSAGRRAKQNDAYERLAYRPAELAAMVGLSTKAIYRAVERGELKAAKVADATDATPYTLRHSFCSLLLAEGRSVIEVARQLGHGANLTLSTYGHVIDELAGADRVDAEAAIRAARQRMYPFRTSGEVSSQAREGTEGEETAPLRDFREMGDPGLEPGTSSLSEKRSDRLS